MEYTLGYGGALYRDCFPDLTKKSIKNSVFDLYVRRRFASAIIET